MKKIVCISLCVLLCVPLLALSAFAESTSTVFVSLPSNPDFNANIIINGRGDGSLGNPVSAPVPVGSVFSINVGATNGSSNRLVLVSYNGVRLSTDPDNPTVIPYSTNISFTGSLGLYYTYYAYIEPPSPLDELGVSDGVSSFIGFSGDVLHFITNNSAILTLLGLSVGLCLVIPFGISKLKELVKGY